MLFRSKESLQPLIESSNFRNKKNKWIITTCGALVNGKEFDTKEDAEKHLAQKKWEDILTAALIFFTHVKNQMENTKKE